MRRLYILEYLEGRQAQALESQLRYLDLINGLFMEVNPIPVKEAMNLMGLKAGYYRMPLYPMAEGNRAKLAEIMKAAGLL